MIKHINIIIISAIILLTTLLIGTPVYMSNIHLMYIALGVFAIYYYISAIINKEKIYISKVDLGVIILALSSLIPLIFSTYVSISGTINIIIRNFAILNLYIITKQECRKNDRYVDIIINTIIISILILCVFGLDEINGNYLINLKKLIRYQYVKYDEQRIGSLFSYANVMASVCCSGIFLSIGYIFKSRKLYVKIAYAIVAIIMFITMILTYSRLVYILFTLTAIMYLLITLKKYKPKYTIKKREVIIFTIIAMAIITYVIVGLGIPSKLEIKDSYQKIMYSVKSGEKYKFTFNIKAKTLNEENNPFTIKITEKNKYFDDIKITEIGFGTFSGEKEINVKTEENTSIIYINIDNKEKDAIFIINDTLLNGREFILKYKLLPTGVINKVQGINLKNKSVWERLTFIKDGIEIIKENWLFGLGGEAWENVQCKVQAYKYTAKEVHSFLVNIFIENGILGFIASLVIIIYILKKLIAETRKQNLDMKNISIIFAIIFILAHSLLDFDMSFVYVLTIVSVLIAILSLKEESKIKINNASSIILIFLASVVIYVSSMQINYKKNTDILRENNYWTEEKIYNIYYRLLPFNKENKNKYYKNLQGNGKVREAKKILKDIIVTEKYDYFNISLERIYNYIKLNIDDVENINSELQFSFKYTKETQNLFRFNADFQLNRFNNLKKIIVLLEENNITEYKSKFSEQLKTEIKDKEKNILDNEKSRYDKNEVEKYRTYLNEFETKIY